MDKKAFFINYCRVKASAAEWVTLWEGSQKAIVSPTLQFGESSSNPGNDIKNFTGTSQTYATTIFSNTPAKFKITYTRHTGEYELTGDIVVDNTDKILTPTDNSYGIVLSFSSTRSDLTYATNIVLYNDRWESQGTYYLSSYSVTNPNYGTTYWRKITRGNQVTITKIEAFYEGPNVKEWNIYREDNYFIDDSIYLGAKTSEGGVKLPADGTKIYLKTVADWSSSNQQPTVVNEIVELTVGPDAANAIFAQNAECTITVQAHSSYFGIFYEMSKAAILRPKLKIYWAYAE